MTAPPAASPTLRERHHRLLWWMMWPIRTWFTDFPIHRGKGLLLRAGIKPLLPPEPAAFAHRLPSGDTIDLFYREGLGLKVLLEGQYEAHEIAEFCRRIPPGTWVIDAGANIGVTALAFSRAVGSTGVVIALEPHPATAARLEANLTRNAAANVRIERVAVGDRTGSVTFHESADATLSSATIRPSQFLRSFEVPLTTVDAVWEAAGSPQVSAFKVDVEGGELAVLRGAGALLARYHPAIMLEAWGPAQLDPITAFLKEFGYVREQPEGFAERNYIFAAPQV